jgi:LysR substrate binding domain
MARYAIGTGFIGGHSWTMTGVEHAENMIDLFRNVSIAGGLLVSRPPAAIEDTRFPVGPTGSVDVRIVRPVGKIRWFAKRAMRKRVPAPTMLKDPRFTSVSLKKLQLSWMSSPSLIADSHVLSLEEIANYPILMQIGTSGVDAIYERWFESENISIRRTFAGNSLIALSSLTVSGFGVSYLPSAYFADLVDQGLLKVLHSTRSLPTVRYYAIYRNDGPTPLYSMVADLARRLCDFSKPDLASVVSRQASPTSRLASRRCGPMVGVLPGT